MRVRNSFLLAVSVYTAQFLSTESYVLRPIRPSPPAGSSSASFKEAPGANGYRLQIDNSPAGRHLQLYCSERNDSPASTCTSSWRQQLVKAVKGPVAGLVTAFLLFFVGIRGASARPPRASSASNAPQKTAVRQNNNARGSTKTKQVAKKVEVEITVDKKGNLNSQLSKIGFVLVGVSTVATLLSGDEKKAKKTTSKQITKTTKAPKRPTPPVTIDDEDDEDDYKPVKPSPIAPRNELFQDRKGSMGISKKVRKGLGNMNALPPPEELFSSDEAKSFFSDEPIQKVEQDQEEDEKDQKEEEVVPLTPVRKLNKFSLPPSKKVEKAPAKAVEREYTPVEEEDSIDITPLPSKSLPAPAPPAKKSIFDRIFKKGSTTRPTDLGELLRVEDTASDFRTATATVLTAYLPEDFDLFADVQSGGVLSYSGGEDISSEESRKALLIALKEDLLPKEAADAFADVTNAMLVSLTDVCVEKLDKRGKTPEEIEASSVKALDLLTDFAVSAAGLFGQILPGVIIEDGGIKYNGKANRGKLETLFSSYLKTSLDLGPMKAMMAGGDEGDEIDPEAAEMKAQQQQGKLQCLQHVFSISEGKRSSLEQKAMKDMIMGMVGGDGAGMGDLMGMLGNMGGPGGADGKGMSPKDEAAFNKMMEEAQRGAGGAGGDGDMDPAQMAAVLNESLGEMRQQLKSGSVTKDDVAELERSMGMGLKEMVGMVEMAKKMAGKQKIPEIDEMLSLFKQLLALKK